MPTPKSAARIALDELLADGQWHDRADAIEHMAPYVPPGQAIRRAIGQVLADGEWHDRAQVIDLIAPHVPPGQAIRTAHRQRARLRTARGNPGPANPIHSRPRDDRAVGAGSVARDTIRHATKYRSVEQTTAPDGTILIRKAP